MQPEGSDEWDLQVLEVGFGPGSFILSRDTHVVQLRSFQSLQRFFLPPLVVAIDVICL